MMRWVVLCVVVMVLVFVGFVNVKVVEYDFEVVYVDVVLDCYVKMVIGINGVYLGLIICVVQGDILKIMFYNYIVMEGIMMYWYGICQVLVFICCLLLLQFELCYLMFDLSFEDWDVYCVYYGMF